MRPQVEPMLEWGWLPIGTYACCRSAGRVRDLVAPQLFRGLSLAQGQTVPNILGLGSFWKNTRFSRTKNTRFSRTFWTFDISKFRGFLNLDLGMTGGSVNQRFSPAQIWKNYRIGAGVARDATKNSLVGELQRKIKRNFRFSGFSFFPKSRFSGFSKMARCRPVIISKLWIFIVSVK